VATSDGGGRGCGRMTGVLHNQLVGRIFLFSRRSFMPDKQMQYMITRNCHSRWTMGVAEGGGRWGGGERQGGRTGGLEATRGRDDCAKFECMCGGRGSCRGSGGAVSKVRLVVAGGCRAAGGTVKGGPQWEVWRSRFREGGHRVSS